MLGFYLDLHPKFKIYNPKPKNMLIKENICCYINNFKIEISAHLCHFIDVHYFQVIIHDLDKIGLLRVGSLNGGLEREMQLRKKLGEHKMISPLLASLTVELIDLSNLETVIENNISRENNEESEYLEEEFYEEINSDLKGEKLVILSEMPESELSLETWLKQNHSLEECLLMASQICQFFRNVYQWQWCFISLFPKLIKISTPIQFFDLTSVYQAGEKLNTGLVGEYYPPELAYGHNISEQMSSYVVATFLYQAIHQHFPTQREGMTDFSESIDLKISKIPGIYQILTIALTPIPEERFPLSQLVNILVTTRKSLTMAKVRWEIANRSTVGLSINRLENEDSYGILQPCLNNADSLVLAVVADGMGGLSHGEVASKLAVKTVLETRISGDLTTAQKRADWLIYLVEKANESISKTVNDGGTTISVVLAVGRELNIAHVGDSRIFLLRNNTICQISEDHSMVAMLLASGQITYEESLNHSDRNILLKSLGTKPRLSDGYVQDLSHFSWELSLTLENEDILILCSDGVWDLVVAEELAEIFTQQSSLQVAVEQTIEKVLQKGAHDNATVVALKCYLENSYL